MNEQLQKQLAEMLAALTATVQQGATWVGGQIPPLVQEKILYGRIEHTVLGLVFVLVAWQAGVYARVFYRQAVATKGDDRYAIWPERPGGLASIGAALVCVVAAGWAVSHLDYALMAFVAPRLFIVEWLAYLAGNR